MDSSFLVRKFGFAATLVHGDTLVLDRWRWLKRRLPVTSNAETLLDVGCGTGAFAIGASRRGYRTTGVSWDERNQQVAQLRAGLCRAPDAKFIVGDARRLDEIHELDTSYDVVTCTECIEHICDDRKLFIDIASRVKPGGRLLLTTPNYYYVPMTKVDRGPFVMKEDGGHVRRGYTEGMLAELCAVSGLNCTEVSYCSGIISQKITALSRIVSMLPFPRTAGWAIVLPLRVLPAVFPDRWITTRLDWPFFSICLEAYKPRFRDIEKGE